MIDYENRPGQYRGLIEVYCGVIAGPGLADWYWRAKGKNGQIVADGSEGYKKRQGCVNAVERLLSARLEPKYGRYEGDSVAIRPTNCLIPWRLVVFNRDGSVNREGALY